MSEYVSKKAVLGHILREIGITERQRDAVMTRHMKEFHGGAIRALQNLEHTIQSGAFDADESEGTWKATSEFAFRLNDQLEAENQRLRALLERLDSYIDFSEHLSPGDWGIEDVTGINSLFDEVREALSTTTEPIANAVKVERRKPALYQVRYIDNHGTWKEPRATEYFRSPEEAQEYLDFMHRKTRVAENIRVLKTVDVTREFSVPSKETLQQRYQSERNGITPEGDGNDA